MELIPHAEIIVVATNPGWLERKCVANHQLAQKNHYTSSRMQELCSAVAPKKLLKLPYIIAQYAVSSTILLKLQIVTSDRRCDF